MPERGRLRAACRPHRVPEQAPGPHRPHPRRHTALARVIREVLYWRLVDAGWTVSHASAATYNGAGVLFVGDSGAGRSTTALAVAASEGGRHMANQESIRPLLDTPDKEDTYA